MKRYKNTYSQLAFFSVIFIIVLGLEQCSKSDDNNVTPDSDPMPTCDLSNVTFSGTVWPIISANCTSCHSGASPNAGVRLEDYETIKFQAGIPAGSRGSLIGAISHNSGNTPMPQNASKLDDCTISKINKWIQNGMPNN